MPWSDFIVMSDNLRSGGFGFAKGCIEKSEGGTPAAPGAPLAASHKTVPADCAPVGQCAPFVVPPARSSPHFSHSDWSLRLSDRQHCVASGAQDAGLSIECLRMSRAAPPRCSQAILPDGTALPCVDSGAQGRFYRRARISANNTASGCNLIPAPRSTVLFLSTKLP